MFNINEIVTIKSLGIDGIIKQLYSNKAKVAVKSSVIMVSFDNLKGTGIIKPGSSKAYFSKIVLKSNEIDLHNLTYEQAVDALDIFMNNALSSNTKKLHIIHGNGKGVMKKAVDEVIEKYASLIDFSDYAPLNAGGLGATQVILK